jgi:hypothetical protein
MSQHKHGQGYIVVLLAPHPTLAGNSLDMEHCSAQTIRWHG